MYAVYIQVYAQALPIFRSVSLLKVQSRFAPGVAVKDEKTGKMVQKKEHYKDTSKLRSVLFSTMRREVAYFSDQCVRGTHEKTRQYHQV